VAGFTISLSCAENLASARMELTGTRCHPHQRKQELIQKMLNRGRRVFNASNINLLSISFNVFALGPFHIFQDVIIFVIPITCHCKSTTIVLNTVSTTDNQHFFVIYFIYLKKKTSFSSFKFNISEFQQLRNEYVKVHLAIVIRWLGQYPLLNKLGVLILNNFEQI
jgi:hypothetical protein